MDLLLINPKVPSQKKIDRVPNFGVLCLASYLNSRGYQSQVFDLVQENVTDLLAIINRYHPNLIGYSCTSAVSYYEAAQVCKVVKDLFQIPAVAGGQHITGLLSSSEHDLEPLFDCHISGSGEETLEAILSKLHSGDFLLPKVIYSKPLNSFCPIDYQLYPNFKSFIPCIEVVRGCNYSCRFCNASSMRKAMGYKYRDVAEIEREIEKIIYLYGEDADIFLFGPIFGNEVNKTIDLLRMLRKFPGSLKYTFNMRIDNLWQQYLDLLDGINIRSVFFGMESASERILKAMNKTSDPAKYIKDAQVLFKVFSEHDVPFFVSFIMGYWGETIDSVRETQLFIQENRQYLRAISVNPYQIYPGSYDYQHLDMLSEKYDAEYSIDPHYQLITIERMNQLTVNDVMRECELTARYCNIDTEYYRKVRDWRFF